MRDKDMNLILDLAVAIGAGVYCRRCKEVFYEGIKEHFEKHLEKGDTNEEDSQHEGSTKVQFQPR